MKIIVLLLLILADFITKKLVYNLIDLNNFTKITFFFDITHIHNYGISFGLFADFLPPWIIISVGLVIIIFLFNWMLNTKSMIEKWAILFIIAGAISNIGDRIINNYVLDFIYFHYNQYYWPAFNFADIYISLGILLFIFKFYKLLITSLRGDND